MLAVRGVVARPAAASVAVASAAARTATAGRAVGPGRANRQKNAYATAATASALNLNVSLDVPVAQPSSLPVKGRAPEAGAATLANGVRVAAYETFGPVATIAVAVQAGSRFETHETIGAAQALKHFGFRSTAHRSAVRFAREIESIGGTLSTTGTRELVIFSAEVLRDRIPDAVDVLVDVARATRFTDYEVADVAHVAKSESLAALAVPEIRITEALHRTAFRTSLGNGLYAAVEDAGGVSADALRQYFYSHATAPSLAIVGAGVGLADLQGLAQKGLGSIAGTAAATVKAKYHGGDARIEAFRDPISRYALGFSGPSIVAPELPAFTVLSHILGGESSVKWGTGASSLSRTAAKLSGSASLSSFLLPYADAGLFGVYVEAPSASLTAAVNAAVADLKKAAQEVSAADLARGKAQAKRAALSAYDTRAGTIAELARQATSPGKARLLGDTLAAIDKVTTDDVLRAASAALKSKPTAVAYGDVHEAPLSVGLGL